MGIKNAVSKTIAYAKRNGTRAAFFAALERLSDNKKENYTYVPLSEAVCNEQKQEYKLLAEAGCRLRFSIVVPLFNTPEKYLRQMIESVIAQTYGNWELILADASEEPLEIVSEYTKVDPRIKHFHLDKNGGISENTNCGLEKASGDYIGLLDHDDVLTPDALYEVSRVIRKSMTTNKLVKYAGCPLRVIYSDEDKFDDNGNYFEHHAKPAFNMDYLMSNNYICHFTMLRADIIKRLKLRKEYDGAQDYDLFLRACSEEALKMPQAGSHIAHIEKVLYHWRSYPASTSANPASKTYAYEAGQRALQDMLFKNGINGKAEQLKHVGFYRVTYTGDIFETRQDIGCVGGKIINGRHKICGGMYHKDGTVVYDGLHEEFSGGLQHRAVLQQDAYAVDIRCIKVRKELVPVFEEITGCKYAGYENSSDAKELSAAGDEFNKAKELSAAGDEVNEAKELSAAGDEVNKAKELSAAGDEVNKVKKLSASGTVLLDVTSLTPDEVRVLSLKFCEEVRRRGLRILWDPEIVLRLEK